jgi:CheY-like chemotaxis protein
VDLNQVLSDLVKLLRRVVGEHITLKTEFSPDLGRARADPYQIEEAVLSLVLNARDAMPSGGQLVMRTANVVMGAGVEAAARGLPAGKYVMISVEDTGVGMSADTMAHLFEPFFTTKEGSGTGLGLATAREIVRQSDGDILVSSQPGVGTAVTVYLPSTDQSSDPAKRPRVASDPRKGGETILLVEDEPRVRELVRRLLDSNGYPVLEAASAEEALRVWDQHRDRIHLLLSDVVMPGLGGLRLAEKLTTERPGLHVVLMTGYGEIWRAVRESHAHGSLLRKPFSPDALLRQVQQALDKPKNAGKHA